MMHLRNMRLFGRASKKAFHSSRPLLRGEDLYNVLGVDRGAA